MSLAFRRHHHLDGDPLLDARDRRDVEPPRQRSGAAINVGRTERLLSMVAGGVLAGYALRRRTTLGGAAAVAGAALLHRGATGHCGLYEMLGVNRVHGARAIAGERDGADTRARLGGSAGVLVEQLITIQRPLAEVYAFWRQLENLPRFLAHLESVTQRPDGTSHWVAKGPAGVRVVWDARIINEIPERVIGWQSLPGATVASAGSVNFSESPLGTTVRVRFQYDPPAGRLGAAIAAMMGDDPAQAVRDDLRRLKVLLEQQGGRV